MTAAPNVPRQPQTHSACFWLLQEADLTVHKDSSMSATGTWASASSLCQPGISDVALEAITHSAPHMQSERRRHVLVQRATRATRGLPCTRAAQQVPCLPACQTASAERYAASRLQIVQVVLSHMLAGRATVENSQHAEHRAEPEAHVQTHVCIHTALECCSSGKVYTS